MNRRTADKMLQAVLADAGLQKYGEYGPAYNLTIDAALCSDNLVVRAVALIIERSKEKYTDKEIYNEVNDYLKNNI